MNVLLKKHSSLLMLKTVVLLHIFVENELQFLQDYLIQMRFTAEFKTATFHINSINIKHLSLIIETYYCRYVYSVHYKDFIKDSN